MTTVSVPLPREVESEKVRDGIRYRLPRRNLGKVRLFALIPIVFGLLFAAVPLTIMAGAFRDVLTRPSFFHAFMGLFLLVFLYAASKPIKYGMIGLFGRCAVTLTRDWLRVVDSAGPFRTSRKARAQDVRRFEVKTGNAKGAPALFAPLENLGLLEAHFDWRKEMPVAVGYPREWLMALGDELTVRLNEVNLTLAQPALPRTTEVVKELSNERVSVLHTEDVMRQPAGSLARMENTGDSVTIILPPRGVWRGSKGLFSFGLLWCGFVTVLSLFALFSGGSGSRLGFGLFVGLFWIIGLGMVLAAINSGRKRGLLMARAAELRVAQESLVGKKAWSWSREQIAAVRAGHSGVEVNNRPVIDLQVHTVDGRRTGFFSGRDEMELQWIATVLRQKLNVPALESSGDPFSIAPAAHQ